MIAHHRIGRAPPTRERKKKERGKKERGGGGEKRRAEGGGDELLFLMDGCTAPSPEEFLDGGKYGGVRGEHRKVKKTKVRGLALSSGGGGRCLGCD